MNIAYELTMPGNNSWNGKWSGDGKSFVIVRGIPNTIKGRESAAKILSQAAYHYSFGDGWRARIGVRPVDGKTATKLKRTSGGFCGYEWMVDEIIRYGKIYGSNPKPEESK